MPVYGLAKVNWYSLLDWQSSVNICNKYVYDLMISSDTVWSIPCLFIAWWSQLTRFGQYHMPVYSLVKSILTQPGWYHACLGPDDVNRCSSLDTMQLTHWDRDKLAAIFQPTFSNVFSRIKMYEFRLRFHWTLFLWVQLIIFQRWFRLGV